MKYLFKFDRSFDFLASNQKFCQIGWLETQKYSEKLNHTKFKKFATML